jgi:hypothetical protein
LAFRNNGVAGRHSLSVILHGPTGNPTAVGARLTLELADGSAQTSEVAAGANYRLDSKTATFFGYSDAVPPRRLRVRWPDGTSTVHEVTAPAATVVLSAP